MCTLLSVFFLSLLSNYRTNIQRSLVSILISRFILELRAEFLLSRDYYSIEHSRHIFDVTAVHYIGQAEDRVRDLATVHYIGQVADSRAIRAAEPEYKDEPGFGFGDSEPRVLGGSTTVLDVPVGG
jgi:hypothetical protein